MLAKPIERSRQTIVAGRVAADRQAPAAERLRRQNRPRITGGKCDQRAGRDPTQPVDERVLRWRGNGRIEPDHRSPAGKRVAFTAKHIGGDVEQPRAIGQAAVLQNRGVPSKQGLQIRQRGVRSLEIGGFEFRQPEVSDWRPPTAAWAKRWRSCSNQARVWAWTST